MNTPQTTPAVCEICLQNGSMCGVAAIGRCATCGRAFCLTHQARHQYGGYADYCLPCQEAKQAVEQKEQEEKAVLAQYVVSGTARADLLRARVRCVEIYRISSQWKSGFLGLGGRNVDEASLIGRGWLLGELKWDNPKRLPVSKDGPIPGMPLPGASVPIEQYLTVLMDLPDDGPNPWSPNPRYPESPWYARPLVPVSPYLRGYKRISNFMDLNFHQDWATTVQAIERLIGASK